MKANPTSPTQRTHDSPRYATCYHRTEPWYAVTRLEPDPDGTPAIAMMRNQLRWMGVEVPQVPESAPWEAARLQSLLAYYLAPVHNIGEWLDGRTQRPAPEPGAARSAVAGYLCEVIELLADVQIYFTQTNHLTDDELLECLLDVVFACQFRGVGDQIFMLSPFRGASGAVPVSRRDRLLPAPERRG